MSKLYDLYKSKKEIDKSKCYLFKSGMFYIFIDEDAKYVSKKTLLKLTNLSNDVVKCGFPYNQLDKYMELFNNLGIEVEMVNNNIDNNLKFLKVLIRISYKQRYISSKNYSSWSKKITNINNLLYGWIKACLKV